jgi:predicted deacylase
MTSPAQLHFQSIDYTGQAPGPRLVIMGATHGNETCGTDAIRGIMADIDGGRLSIVRGSVTFVPVANPLAYARGTRAGERNLNRDLRPRLDAQDFEDRVANWLCPLLARHDVLLDLHSFNASGGAPFVMAGPADNDGPLEPFARMREERALARRLGVRRFVTGWMSAYGGGVQRRAAAGAGPADRETMLRLGVGTTEYMRSVGGYALTLECGQHDDPAAPGVARTAVLNALAHLGIIDAAAPAPVPCGQMEVLHLAAVHDRESEGDRFVRAWTSFDAVAAGETIGVRADGTPVIAELTGRILFPDAAAAPHQEWFYLARPIGEFGPEDAAAR